MGAYSSSISDYEDKKADLAIPGSTGGLMAVLAVRNACPEEKGRYDDILRSMARGLEKVAIKREDYAYYPDCKTGHPFNIEHHKIMLARFNLAWLLYGGPTT